MNKKQDFGLSKTGILMAGIVAIVAINTFGGYKGHRNNDKGTISVSGECIKEITADKHKLNIYVEKRAETSTEANIEVQTSYKKLLDSIKKIEGIELTSSDYSIEKDDEWEWNKNKRKEVLISKSFSARIEVTVESLSKDKIAEVIAKISDKKNVFVKNISSFVSRELLKKIKDDCTEDALLDARTKAINIASTLGERIGKVKNVNIYNHSPRGNYLVRKSMKDVAMMNEIAIPELFDNKEKMTFKANVTFLVK